MDYQGGGGFGGFGGGGNFGGSQSNAGGGFGDNYSPPNSGGGGGGKARRSYDEQTCQPVTIRMILTSKPDPSGDGAGALQLEDERKLHHVKLVAAVRSVEESSVNMMYQIEDGTGLITVKQWINQDECTAMAELREQTKRDHIYVKITGQVKDYDGQYMILADSIRPVSSGNELTHHMLDVVYTSESAKRKSQYVAPQPMMSGIGFQGGPMMRGSALSASGMGSSGNPVSKAIEDYMQIESEKFENGISVAKIQAHFRGRFQEHEIRQVIDQLSGDGTIYTTGMDDHFKFAI